jgi:hypothetical protein
VPSSLREILQLSRGERRSIGRTIINRNVLILFPGHAGVFSCMVRDVTNLGAGLNLTNLKLLPADFDLSFDNFRSVRKCHLMWREGNAAGVKLIN